MQRRAENESSGRGWLARRVDLIVAPASQYYYALVGWTGSKHFNRSLRLYAQRQFGQRLTSHCLYDPATVSAYLHRVTLISLFDLSVLVYCLLNVDYFDIRKDIRPEKSVALAFSNPKVSWGDIFTVTTNLARFLSGQICCYREK